MTDTQAIHHLYRHFDKDGALLYVGVSTNALRRLAEHEAVSGWFNDIASVTIEHFNSRAEVLEAERHAITAENPKCNLMRPGIEREKKSRPDASRTELLSRVVSFGVMYTLKDAADALGLGLTALKRAVDAGELGTVLVQGKVRVTGWQMIDYVEYLMASQGKVKQ